MMTEQKQVIPEGYKQTEIGVIPTQWNVVTLEDVVLPNGLVRGPFGGALKKEYFTKSGFKVYEQRNAIYSSVEIGTYYIDEKKYQELKRFSLNTNDFIVSCSGTIGKIYQIPAFAPVGVINQALLKITLKDSIDGDYFLHVFKSEKFQEKIIDGTQGGAMKNLVGMAEFKKSTIILPTKEEQTAIANALSDVDALISELEKLIAKKQAIKTATMQQLLTGKTRLPEFALREDGTPKGYKQSEFGEIPEDWECCNLSEVYQFKQGIQIPVDKQSQEQRIGYVRFIRIIDLTDDNEPSRFVVDPGKHQHITENDLFMVRYGIPGLVGFNMSGIIANNLFRLLPRRSCSNSFYFHYLGFRHKDIIELSGSSTMPAISFGSLANFQVLNFLLEEQTAIAKILSDIDQDIQMLDKRLNKTRQIKQGMMQELLTGKTRLVKPEVTV